MEREYPSLIGTDSASAALKQLETALKVARRQVQQLEIQRDLLPRRAVLDGPSYSHEFNEDDARQAALERLYGSAAHSR